MEMEMEMTAWTLMWYGYVEDVDLPGTIQSLDLKKSDRRCRKDSIWIIVCICLLILSNESCRDLFSRQHPFFVSSINILMDASIESPRHAPFG